MIQNTGGSWQVTKWCWSLFAFPSSSYSFSWALWPQDVGHMTSNRWLLSARREAWICWVQEPTKEFRQILVGGFFTILKHISQWEGLSHMDNKTCSKTTNQVSNQSFSIESTLQTFSHISPVSQFFSGWSEGSERFWTHHLGIKPNQRNIFPACSWSGLVPASRLFVVAGNGNLALRKTKWAKGDMSSFLDGMSNKLSRKIIPNNQQYYNLLVFLNGSSSISLNFFIWGWVKTLSPCSSHQNSWDLWMFIP